jgi:histidyl-tRNA synthetase
MYTFNDKGERSVTLRPEFTAGVVRAVVSNKLYATEDAAAQALLLRAGLPL